MDVCFGSTILAFRCHVTIYMVAGSIPDEVTGFLNLPNPFSHIMALGLTSPLTEMSTRNLPGVKGQPACKVDNLTAICELTRKCGSLNISQPHGPPRPATGIALLNLSANCEPIVYKMREPRHLTTLWAFTACYRDSFTLPFTQLMKQHVQI
jgi:hypothetical protein